ncbi:MAG: hypothetical protein ACOVT5_08745, partial [Armatimonadaceae bacterium]
MDANSMQCDDFAVCMADVLDGTASSALSEQVERHAAVCAHCAADLAFARSMRSCWPTPERVAVPEGLYDRIASTTWARRPWWRSPSRVWRPALAVSGLVAVGLVGWWQSSIPMSDSVAGDRRVASQGVSSPAIPIRPVSVPDVPRTDVRPVGSVAEIVKLTRPRASNAVRRSLASLPIKAAQ